MLPYGKIKNKQKQKQNKTEKHSKVCYSPVAKSIKSWVFTIPLGQCLWQVAYSYCPQIGIFLARTALYMLQTQRQELTVSSGQYCKKHTDTLGFVSVLQCCHQTSHSPLLTSYIWHLFCYSMCYIIVYFYESQLSHMILCKSNVNACDPILTNFLAFLQTFASHKVFTQM